MPLEVMWRNAVTLVGAYLKAKERSTPYYGWAKQTKMIRARHANWDANHN